MYWGDDKKRQSFTQGYSKFYLDALIPVMRESGISIEHNFMDTSPSNGVKSYDPYVKLNELGTTTNTEMGDVHFYYLVQDCEKDETHTTNRFLSESGL